MTQFLHVSLAPSTRQSYLSGQRRFIEFCVAHSLLHPSDCPFPVSESTLEMFVAHLASSVSYGTIKSYLCAVRSLQIDLGYGDPLVATPRLEHVLRGIRRALSLKSPIRPPRLPVTQNLMLLIRTSLNLADFDHAMFWAAFCTAWFGFLHVSEFTSPPSGFDPAVHLSLNDVAVDCHLHPSAVFLTIKASKTDPFRKGVQLYLPRTDRLLCPVSSLSYFLHHRGNLPGPLFVFSDGTALSRRHVTDRLRSILAAAGVDGNFSSHSFRIGAATSASAAGLSDSLIRTLGRWSSDAYLVYVRTSKVTLHQAASRLASSR